MTDQHWSHQDPRAHELSGGDSDDVVDGSVANSDEHVEGEGQRYEVLAPLRKPGPLAGTAVTGFAMGVAEVVPGFSGGTVALVAGLYTRLVAAIRTFVRVVPLLVRGRFKDAGAVFARADWLFLASLGLGMGIAVLTMASLMSDLIVSHPVHVQAVLFGLVLGAAVVAAGRFQGVAPWHVLLGIVAAVGAFWTTGLGGGTIVDPTLWHLFFGAAVAVCAWILPGISGSFFLLVLGLYPAVLGAVSDRDLVAILVIAVGCVIGLGAFSTVLSWALARAYDLVLAVLIGIMVGSVRVLWPWPSAAGVGSPQLASPESDTVYAALALALGAFALVWLFGLAQAAIERRRGITPHT